VLTFATTTHVTITAPASVPEAVPITSRGFALFGRRMEAPEAPTLVAARRAARALAIKQKLRKRAALQSSTAVAIPLARGDRAGEQVRRTPAHRPESERARTQAAEWPLATGRRADAVRAPEQARRTLHEAVH
jgi:hypothetical protein